MTKVMRNLFVFPFPPTYRMSVTDQATGKDYSIELISLVAFDPNPLPDCPCSKSREQLADNEFELLERHDADGVKLVPATNGVHPCCWESDGMELHYQFEIRIDWPRGGNEAYVTCSASDNVILASFRVNGYGYGIENGKVIK
jgi:hypothetical protein